MERIKFYIEKLSGKKYINRKDKQYEILSQSLDLDDDRKNLIYFYFNPRQLLDMEYPSRLATYRGQLGAPRGFLEPNIVETGLLLEAYRTHQYGRYIRHLLHSFKDPENVFPLEGADKCECGICKREIWCHGAWENILSQYPEQEEEREKKEYLAFGCDQSKQAICLPCLIQLINLDQLLKILEGDHYLDWRLNEWNRKVRTRLGPTGMDAETPDTL